MGLTWSGVKATLEAVPEERSRIVDFPPYTMLCFWSVRWAGMEGRGVSIRMVQGGRLRLGRGMPAGSGAAIGIMALFQTQFESAGNLSHRSEWGALSGQVLGGARLPLWWGKGTPLLLRGGGLYWSLMGGRALMCHACLAQRVAATEMGRWDQLQCHGTMGPQGMRGDPARMTPSRLSHHLPVRSLRSWLW